MPYVIFLDDEDSFHSFLFFLIYFVHACRKKWFSPFYFLILLFYLHDTKKGNKNVNKRRIYILYIYLIFILNILSNFIKYLAYVFFFVSVDYFKTSTLQSWLL